MVVHDTSSHIYHTNEPVAVGRFYHEASLGGWRGDDGFAILNEKLCSIEPNEFTHKVLQ